MIKVGVDIVQISRFEKKFQENKKYFEEKLFVGEELSGPRVEHLAGIFAAKEAVIKALGIGAGSWQEIEILKEDSGKPKIKLRGKPAEDYRDYNSDVSIAHDGDYAVVFVCFYKKTKK